MSSELFLFDRAVANSFSKLEKQDKNIMLSQTATSSALDTPPPFQHAVHQSYYVFWVTFDKESEKSRGSNSSLVKKW